MGVTIKNVQVVLRKYLSFSHSIFSQFKMKPQIHYAEEDCPVTAPDGFPKDDELQFEIEMLDFFKAKVSLVE